MAGVFPSLLQFQHKGLFQKDTPAAGAVEETASANKTVVLKSAGGNKIAVIKIIKEITGLGLVEAKAIADNGGNLKENIPAADAEAIKTQLTEAGAEVELV